MKLGGPLLSLHSLCASFHQRYFNSLATLLTENIVNGTSTLQFSLMNELVHVHLLRHQTETVQKLFPFSFIFLSLCLLLPFPLSPSGQFTV